MNKRTILAALLSLTVSGCAGIKIEDGHACAVAGYLYYGGTCSHLLTDKTEILGQDELLDLLEAQPERKCAPVTGFNVCAAHPKPGVEIVTLPKRGAAIIMPAEDWEKMKLELEKACRLLGTRCAKAKLDMVIARVDRVRLM